LQLIVLAGISCSLDIHAVFYAFFSTAKNEKTAWYLRLFKTNKKMFVDETTKNTTNIIQSDFAV